MIARSGALFARRRSRSGQVLVEVLILGCALVPMLLAVMWLAKLADLRAQSHTAARNLAWECAVRAAQCKQPTVADQVQHTVRVRAYERYSGPVRTAKPVAQGPADLTTFSTDPGLQATDQRGQRLVENLGAVQTSRGSSRFDAGLSQALGQGGRVFNDAAHLLSEVAGPEHFGLQSTAGLFVGKVETMTSKSGSRPDQLNRMANSPQGLPAASLAFPAVRLSAKVAVLADPWAASMPSGADFQSVQRRLEPAWEVARLGPVATDRLLSAWAQPVRFLLSGARAIGLEPDYERFKYHEIDYDLVPADRYGRVGVDR